MAPPRWYVAETVNMVAEVRVKIATAILIESVGVNTSNTNPAIKATGAVPKCSHPRIKGRTKAPVLVATISSGALVTLMR